MTVCGGPVGYDETACIDTDSDMENNNNLYKLDASVGTVMECDPTFPPAAGDEEEEISDESYEEVEWETEAFDP